MREAILICRSELLPMAQPNTVQHLAARGCLPLSGASDHTRDQHCAVRRDGGDGQSARAGQGDAGRARLAGDRPVSRVEMGGVRDPAGIGDAGCDVRSDGILQQRHVVDFAAAFLRSPGVNAAIFRYGVYRSVAAWDDSRGRAAKRAAMGRRVAGSVDRADLRGARDRFLLARGRHVEPHGDSFQLRLDRRIEFHHQRIVARARCDSANPPGDRAG